MNINELGERLDIKKAARLIALSLGRDKPVANKTVYAWVKRGHFPKPIPIHNGAAVWDTNQCLNALQLKNKRSGKHSKSIGEVQKPNDSAQ